MDPVAFQAKWRTASLNLKERTAAQSHFNDLCALLGVQNPIEADPVGDTYTFEKGARKAGGGDGWADVWYKGRFAWEYKGHGRDLDAAYVQLLKYKDALENPPLLVVCDLDRIEIRTNFTNTSQQTHVITIDQFTEPGALATLKRVWTNPNAFHPGTTREEVTAEAAASFGQIALGLHQRGIAPERAAHALMQLLFCLFAEDIGLLPSYIFSRMLDHGLSHPERFQQAATQLLQAMNTGDFVNWEKIPLINGGLFQHIDVPELTVEEIRILREAARLDWSAIEPAIFGTLFERSLDPAKRSQLGAHYTGRADIERVVDPVVMTPLRRRWDEVRATAEKHLAAAEKAKSASATTRNRNAFNAAIEAFLDELRQVKVLDPACGSGNFLYVALERLMDLEKEVMLYRAGAGFPLGFPTITPRQVLGLEINEYAQQLAQVAIWIGYIQWMIQNGHGWTEPVLDTLETIRRQDALLTHHADDTVHETIWPEADYIIGNPPFLGNYRMRSELGDGYVSDLYRLYRGRLPNGSDLCCYFFEKARAQIEQCEATRAGLLATNSIRGGANREVLKRIKETGDIYMAWSDEPWILDGAAVRISIVGFDNGTDAVRILDGEPVVTINSDLTTSVDVTHAVILPENANYGFKGVEKGGAFEVSNELAEKWLAAPANPNGRPNSDVLRRWRNGIDVTRRPLNQWIIDFGSSMSVEDASLYELPFEYAQEHVAQVRSKNRVGRTAQKWWLHRRPVQAMRDAIKSLSRYLVTPHVSKHRVFVWLELDVLPGNLLIVFAREDDYFFGVLHSRAHEVWSLRMGTWLGKGNDPRYTPTTCFETFPLPWPPGTEPVDDPRVIAIGEAAARLNELRENWLNPEGASDAELKKRTLTNLYNARPQWLQNAHAALDRAVWDAYGWDDPDPAAVDEDTILSRLLALNLDRAGS